MSRVHLGINLRGGGIELVLSQGESQLSYRTKMRKEMGFNYQNNEPPGGANPQRMSTR